MKLSQLTLPLCYTTVLLFVLRRTLGVCRTRADACPVGTRATAFGGCEGESWLLHTALISDAVDGRGSIGLEKKLAVVVQHRMTD